jgi:hypothetical protein
MNRQVTSPRYLKSRKTLENRHKDTVKGLAACGLVVRFRIASQVSSKNYPWSRPATIEPNTIAPSGGREKNPEENGEK